MINRLVLITSIIITLVYEFSENVMIRWNDISTYQYLIYNRDITRTGLLHFIDFYYKVYLIVFMIFNLFKSITHITIHIWIIVPSVLVSIGLV